MQMSRRHQDGFTLVELILAIAIMGIVFVAVFSGLATFFKVSASQRSNADMDVVVRQYVEQVSSTQTAYAGCSPGAYGSVTLPPASGSSSYSFASGPTVTYWEGDNAATFNPSCATYNANGVQLITVTIQHTLGNKTQQSTVRFTKRNPS
jgi:prepilin-type N-terminal cleavage/methylation domain-containing protein